jgi:hypothetical protein
MPTMLSSSPSFFLRLSDKNMMNPSSNECSLQHPLSKKKARSCSTEDKRLTKENRLFRSLLPLSSLMNNFFVFFFFFVLTTESSSKS